MNTENLIQKTTEIAVTMVSNNKVEANEVPQLIANIYNSLYQIENPTPPQAEASPPPKKTRRSRKQVEKNLKAPVVDEKEAEKVIIEEVANDSFDEISEGVGDDEVAARPEPMFED